MEEGKQSEYNKSTQRINNMTDYVVIEIGMPFVDRSTYNKSQYSMKSKVKPVVYTEPPYFTSPTEHLYSMKDSQISHNKNYRDHINKIRKQSQYLLYPTKHQYYGSQVRKCLPDMYIDSKDIKSPSHNV